MIKKFKICIVRSKYNDTSRLLKSATKELIKRKINYKILEVPGAFEIPVLIAKNINKFDVEKYAPNVVAGTKILSNWAKKL